MTPAELKQALRCHIYSISGDCSQCPLKGKMYAVCSKELETEVLNYIDELEWRAKKAERALQIAADLGELCAPMEDYIEQAKRELAEEGKDG